MIIQLVSSSIAIRFLFKARLIMCESGHNNTRRRRQPATRPLKKEIGQKAISGEPFIR